MAAIDLQLTIDTCNADCAVALSAGSGADFACLAEDTRSLGRGHAEVLAPQVSELLEKSGHTLSDITRITVTTGPGSFTGQRVGLSFARMLAASLEVPCLGIGVLEALLSEAGHGSCVAILDARRDAVYVAVRDADGSLRLPPRLVPLSDLTDILKDFTPFDSAIGHGRHFLSEYTIACHVLIDQDVPGIKAIARLGAVADTASHPAIPLYLRGADAKKQVGKSLSRAAHSKNLQVPA